MLSGCTSQSSSGFAEISSDSLCRNYAPTPMCSPETVTKSHPSMHESLEAGSLTNSFSVTSLPDTDTDTSVIKPLLSSTCLDHVDMPRRTSKNTGCQEKTSVRNRSSLIKRRSSRTKIPSCRSTISNYNDVTNVLTPVKEKHSNNSLNNIPIGFVANHVMRTEKKMRNTKPSYFKQSTLLKTPGRNYSSTSGSSVVSSYRNKLSKTPVGKHPATSGALISPYRTTPSITLTSPSTPGRVAKKSSRVIVAKKRLSLGLSKKLKNNKYFY